MKLKDGKIYFKKDLLAYLKSKGLPFSYPTLIKYEKAGLIKSPKMHVGNFPDKWRVYTGEEIKEIAEKLLESND